MVRRRAPVGSGHRSSVEREVSLLSTGPAGSVRSLQRSRAMFYDPKTELRFDHIAHFTSALRTFRDYVNRNQGDVTGIEHLERKDGDDVFQITAKLDRGLSRVAIFHLPTEQAGASSPTRSSGAL
jgi:hypothetical protein